jgi:hypothetical protein
MDFGNIFNDMMVVLLILLYIYFTIIIIIFFVTKLLKVSCTFRCNHQATDLKKYEFTAIVLETTNPYLADRVEFKHQFV